MAEKIPIQAYYLCTICLLMCVNFSAWQIKSTDNFDHLFFGESLKLERVWYHTVNLTFLFNVYKRFF